MTVMRRTSIILLLCYTLLATILRSIRLPNDFAKVHWLLDYRFGWLKRGLIGELLSRVTNTLSLPITENLITILSGAAFLVFCLVMILVSLQIIQNAGWSVGSILAALAFLSSSFMVMSAHLFGYFDHIVMVLGVLSIVLLLKGKMWSGVVLQIVGLFIHENSLFLSFVPFCLAWLLTQLNKRKSISWVLSFLPLLLPAGAFILITVSMEGLVSQDFIEAFSERLMEFPFISEYARLNAPIWLSTPMTNYYTAQSVDFFRRIGSIAIYIFFLPSAIGSLVFALKAFKILEYRRLTTLALIACSLAPQLMHLVAWDTFRIWTYTIYCAFISLWIYSKVFPMQGDPFANGLFPLIILLINAMLAVPLMDGETERFSLWLRLAVYLPMFLGGAFLVYKQNRKMQTRLDSN